MTSLSGTVSRMLREVMFASGVWYCVLLCVSQAVGALDISLAVMVGHFRARKKSILSTQTFLSFFGPRLAGATRLRKTIVVVVRRGWPQLSQTNQGSTGAAPAIFNLAV